MTLLVLDGNSIVNRAFYGIKLLTTKDGFYTNAIYGFMNILEKLNSEVKPDAVAIAFDLKAPTFRHIAYEGYKAHRKGMPQELALQMPELKKLLVALGYVTVEKEGFEADDIIGTLAKACSVSGDKCVIATGDRDSLQLVDENVSVRITATKFGKPNVTIYDVDKIKETFGITPKQLIEVKALQGDTSDNIPGVSGIGEKGALSLIQNYHDIDYIYKNIDELDLKPAMRKKLTEGKESAFMSHMLGTIKNDVPIDCNINSYVKKTVDNKEAIQILRKLEMFSTINKLGLSFENLEQEEHNVQDTKVTLKYIEDEKDLTEAMDSDGDKIFIFCCYGKDKKLICLSFKIGDNIFTVRDKKLCCLFSEKLSSNYNKEIIIYDCKQFFLSINNILPEISFDILLAAYILNPDAKDYSIERLCEENSIKINYDKLSIETIEDEDIKNCIKACNALPILFEILSLTIKERKQEKLLKEIEIPFARVLTELQAEGFRVDARGIEGYSTKISEEIAQLEKEIFELIGYSFNLKSSKQLSKALFEDLGLKHGKKTKSGYSTSAEVLEGLKYSHPCIGLILRYRTLTKLKSTYCDGLLKVIREDGKIHTTFNQTETRTGRISSLDPNLQNIPVRTKEGREFRRFFIADEGCVLIDADYSQIELRVLADIANDKNMINAFNNNEDIHTTTAAQVFNLPEIMITPSMRTSAKAVNFGIVYGIGAFSLAKEINTSVKQAKEYIDGYLAHFKGIDRYMKDIITKASKDGFVTTLFGRRRYLPELNSSNHNLRAFGERVARNMPIQGTAADIIKIASINVFNRLKKENMKSKIIMQVHDELIVQSPIDEVKKATVILKEEMENCVKLQVSLSVDIKEGKTWYETKE